MTVLKNSVSDKTKRCGIEGLMTVSTYMDVYGRILEYSIDIVIYVKSM
jgi:hypothetical protein